MSKKLHIYVLMVALFYSMSIFADKNDAHDLASQLSHFNSMTANFAQILYDSSGNVIQKNTGQMALKRPGKFRWQVDKPNKQLLIADGRFLWIYDEDLEQATKQKLDKNQANSPAWLLSGSVTSLEDRFLIYRVKKGEPGEWFQLKPDNQKDLFKWIQLHFVQGNLTEMQLYDNLGQLSKFVFTNIKINPNLPNNVFQFSPPKGVDVVEN
jgi:outer membrane lipoprotein carrier protein